MSMIYRYGVSLLSRDNHIKAQNEELMVDKETGQILLKRVDGNIMSYDAMTRFRQSAARINDTATKQLMFGKIYANFLDNKPLPCAFENGEELLIGDEEIFYSDVKKIILQLDVDVYDDESKFGDSKSYEDVMVKLVMEHDSNTIEKELKLLDLSITPITFDTSSTLTIKSIQISDQSNSLTTHFVINNILAIVV